MELRVNGEVMVIEGPITVRGLIEQLELGEGPVAVERNGQVVARADHCGTELADGDVIEIVHFVGGG